MDFDEASFCGSIVIVVYQSFCLSLLINYRSHCHMKLKVHNVSFLRGGRKTIMQKVDLQRNLKMCNCDLKHVCIMI
jgi:hypothetical protein